MIHYYFWWLLHGKKGHYSYRITSHYYSTKHYIFKLSIAYTKTDGNFQLKFCAQTHLSILTILLFLSSTSPIKKIQNYRKWSLTITHLEPETLNVFTTSPNWTASLCLNCFVSTVFTKRWQEVVFSITGKLIYHSCCTPSWCPSDARVLRRQHTLVLTGQACLCGINHVRGTSLHIKTLPRSYLLLLWNWSVPLNQNKHRGGKRARFLKSARIWWEPFLRKFPLHPHKDGERAKTAFGNGCSASLVMCVHVCFTPSQHRCRKAHTLAAKNISRSYRNTEKRQLLSLHNSLFTVKSPHQME